MKISTSENFPPENFIPEVQYQSAHVLPKKGGYMREKETK